MRRLLIISPNFPPVNAPDMHRVRMSLPHFAEFGWEARVLAVDPDRVEGVREPLLLETIPPEIPVHRCGAFDVRWTRKIGIGALALRAFPFLYRSGARLIREHRPDLVFFSTTMFPVLPLGRLWKQRFGVPFVVDLQDPWVSDYYEKRPGTERPPKYALAQRMHRILEPFTMRAVDGIIAVTDSYHETLRRRYPWIPAECCRTIPFGASKRDFEVAAAMEWRNRFFTPGDGLLHGVYVGVLGRIMTETCRAICSAFRRGLDEAPEIFAKVRLHFIGTDYAPADRARPTIRPLASVCGLEEFIFEETNRVPYFSALRLLRDADFLLLPGSDNADYTASKLYPYILARRPLLSMFREESSVVSILKQTRAGTVVSFGEQDGGEQIAEKLYPAFDIFLRSLPFTPATSWNAFEPYLAREMTRRQCELFDLVVAERSTQPA
ncbi:MAG: glycosyltransferase [Chthoniobacterales bacterium]